MLVIKKTMLLSALLMVIAIIFFSVVVPYTIITVFIPKPTYSFVIDPGHGGIDGGVMGKVTGIYERELNLSVSEKLADYFVNSGFGVIMTRKNKYGLYNPTQVNNFKRADMEKRAEIINEANATAVISIHMNNFPSAARRGAQVFFNRKSESSVLLGKSVQATLNEAINIVHSGREYSALHGDYFITKCSNTPTIIVECGFLSNPLDEKLLVDEKFQMELAYHIFSGVMSYVLTA